MARPSPLSPDPKYLTPAFARRLDEFVIYLRDGRNASRHTVTNYDSDLRQFAAWLRGEGGLAPTQGWRHVTYLMIRRYLSHLAKENYSRTSMARKLAAVKAFFKWLEREGHVAGNPAAQVLSPKTQRALPDVLEVGEIERMLELPDLLDAAGKRDRALLEALYATGMRAAECAALTLDDVDWRAGEIRVRSGKGNRERIVLLGRPALSALRDYLQNARPELLSYEARKQARLAAKNWDVPLPKIAPHQQPLPTRKRVPGQSASRESEDVICDALWLSRRGNAMTPLAIHMVVKHYAARAGLTKRVTPHTLRHSFATHLLQNGADLRVVQELLGHRSLASTQIYTRLGAAHLRRVHGAAHPRARMAAQQKKSRAARLASSAKPRG